MVSAITLLCLGAFVVALSGVISDWPMSWIWALSVTTTMALVLVLLVTEGGLLWYADHCWNSYKVEIGCGK
jgi:hypothetical protein